MRTVRHMTGIGLALALAGCGRGEAHEGAPARVAARSRPAAAAPAPPPAPPLSAADSARARQRVAAERDSVRAVFDRAHALAAREVAELRQDRNRMQVATAESLGVRAGGEAGIRRLVGEGRLVALGDSTPYWVLRDMDHSVPYVTPDTRAMLEQLGRRFQARLARLGLPPYRMKVTSALRTDETQAELRKINSYASRTLSAHEFGTTVDVSHERFAVPAPPAGAGGAWGLEAEMLEEEGKEHAKVLQAELGRAIAELRDQGALHVMMENKQPVYHMTIARHFLAAR